MPLPEKPRAIQMAMPFGIPQISDELLETLATRSTPSLCAKVNFATLSEAICVMALSRGIHHSPKRPKTSR